jgi:hypothetical protein
VNGVFIYLFFNVGNDILFYFQQISSFFLTSKFEFFGEFLKL